MNMLISQAVLETKLLIRKKDALFWTLAFPVFFMVLFGLIYGDSTWQGMDIRSVDYLLPGIVVMGVMITGIMHTVNGFVTEREKGIYRRLALTPLKRQSLIGGQMLHNYLVIIIQTILLLNIGVMAFNINITGNMFLFWLVLSIGSLSFMSLGFALTGMVKSYRSAIPLNQMIFFVMMFLGGLFFPGNILPSFLKHIADVLPSTHMNDALRVVLYQGGSIGDIWQDLLVMTGWALGCLAISIKFFRWE